MADSFTSRLELIKPEVGGSDNTWGTKLNQNLDRLDTFLGSVTGSLSSGGTATAYTVTTGMGWSGYVTGLPITFRPHATSTGAATLNVDGLGAKPIHRYINATEWPAVAGDLVFRRPANLVYNTAADLGNGAWILVNPQVLAGNASALTNLPLGAGLTAIQGLTPAADRLPYFTGASTAALATFTSFGRSLVDDADAAAARTTLGLGTLAVVNSPLPVANGGTGATTAANARTNLGLNAIAANGGWEHISTAYVSSAVSTVEVSLPTGFNAFRVQVLNLIPETTGTEFRLRCRHTGGSFLTGASDYRNAAIAIISSGIFTQAGGSSSFIPLMGNVQFGEASMGDLLVSPDSGHPQILSTFTGRRNDIGYTIDHRAGASIDFGRLDRLRFFFSSGQITSGSFILSGIRAP